MAGYTNLKRDIDNWYASGDRFKWDNCDIFYQKMGSGPVLLMIHGFPTAGADWCDMADELSKQFTIIAADIADAGHSLNPRKKTYTLHEHADMLEALMKHLDVSSVNLVGHDVGDAICQEIIARQNEQKLSFNVSSCAFLNGGILMTAHRPRNIQSQLAGPYGFIVARFMRKKTLMGAVAAVMGSKNKPDKATLEVLWLLSKSVNGRPSLARRSHNLANRRENAPRWVKALQETKIPMCMINGIEDPISGAHACDAIEAQLPHIGITRLPGVGHFPLIEAPQTCVTALLKFHQEINQ
jgi:pimeloyl-ACP methyl ester carboxylesterase